MAFVAEAQLNLKVGYNLGIVNPKVQNSIYESYNQENPWLDSPFGQFRTMSGLQLGLRYKFLNRVALELGLQTQFHRKTASGTDPVSKLSVKQTPNFLYSSFGLGIETFVLESISCGASLNYDRLNISNTTQDLDKFVVSMENGWSSHIFLSINIAGNSRLNLSIRPYAQIPWTSFDLYPLKQSILGANAGPVERIEQDYTTFGLMIIFYNGPT